MRIMLLVPSVSPSLNQIPEIRTITSMHTALVLNGPVPLDEVYDHAQRGNYEIVHIGTHKDTYEKDDILQFSRMAGAKLVFLNQCYSGETGSYLVAHGIPFVIVTNVELEDREAWKMPKLFYEYLARMERTGPISYSEAYVKADSGEGNHSFLVQLALLGVAESLERRVRVVEDQVLGWRRLTLILIGVIATLSVLLTIWGIVT